MSLIKKVQALRQEILHIAARHGAREVRVFGSLARGEETSDSDVDFLVDMESGRSVLDHAALILDLQDLLDARVDVVTPNALLPRLRERILAESRLL